MFIRCLEADAYIILVKVGSRMQHAYFQVPHRFLKEYCSCETLLNNLLVAGLEMSEGRRDVFLNADLNPGSAIPSVTTHVEQQASPLHMCIDLSQQVAISSAAIPTASSIRLEISLGYNNRLVELSRA